MFQCSLGELKQLKSLAYVFNPASTTYTQTVRWHRKPRWIPVAKSKLFRIPVRPVIPLEEKLELFKLHNNYRTQMKAVRRFIMAELANEERSLTNVDSVKSKTEEAIDFERCILENEKWNAEVAETRKIRLAKMAEERENQILTVISHREERHQARLREAEEKVRQFKEQSKTFITRETLDEAIEAAMRSVVDYNFAIDNDGNIHAGREGGIQSEEQQEARSS